MDERHIRATIAAIAAVQNLGMADHQPKITGGGNIELGGIYNLNIFGSTFLLAPKIPAVRFGAILLGQLVGTIAEDDEQMSAFEDEYDGYYASLIVLPMAEIKRQSPEFIPLIEHLETL